MTHARVKDLRTGSTAATVDRFLESLPGLVSGATTQYVDLLRRTARLAGELLPAGSSGANDCCTVPTQDCPPRCVAEIDWEACPGETLHATVHVANTGSTARDFGFAATGLAPAKVEVSPSSAALAPGASVAVAVTVYPADGLKPGETLRGELLIRGAYEQCVCLSLRVAATQTPQVCVAQGDPPQRVTELAWHRHYQCIEPCAPARGPNDPPTRGTAVGAQG